MLEINNRERILTVNQSYDDKKTLTEILTDFSLISKDFEDFQNKEHISVFDYSDYNYIKCTDDEKRKYIRTRLQKIETLVLDKIYNTTGNICSMKEILGILTDDEYAKTDKGNRYVAYFSNSYKRPVGDTAYLNWNGIQVIDLDIKDREIAVGLKEAIFKELCQYHWFLGVYFSASGKGLHVWTKITPITMEFNKRKVEFLCNFRHKYSYVYTVLISYNEHLNYTKEQATRFLDMAMAKPQQGIFISSDKKPYFNTNFKDYRLDVNFEGALNNGTTSIDWINHPDLKNMFKKLEWFANDEVNKVTDVERDDISNIEERDGDKNQQKHYKYNQRWQLANTLTSIYGKDLAMKYIKECCTGTEIKELVADINTAARHNKPISLWAVKELNTYHGFNIKVNESVLQEAIDKEINKDVDVIDFINTEKQKVILHINSTQYLSNIQEDIVNNLGKITLLEAGAGYGKTEMIKALKAKTLLILPFTSTIKSKIEASEVTSDWKYFYGNKRPTFDDLKEPNSISMTIDKFSKLNVMELDTGKFEYIVLDESHLLYTSSYRDVMAPTIQRLANCKAKVIMMTGTPTGELLFFPNIRHIKVIKDDTRKKKFDLHMSYNDINRIKDIVEYITEDIIQGRKVLFPTNNGILFFNQLVNEVNLNLFKRGYNREAKSFYYKKSNYGEKSMEDINYNKTIGDNDIILCTTYLSVGVDICEADYTFSIYFIERMIPQDIEQFANRLRKNDLFIHMFLPIYDKSGNYINYFVTEDLDLSINNDSLVFARDLLKTVNDVIERNSEENKYNPLVNSLIAANLYIKYDENEGKYFVDETTYKLHMFEERYHKYATQLSVMIQSLKDFGYEYTKHDNVSKMSDNDTEGLKNRMKETRQVHWDEKTLKTFKFIEHISDDNIDIYKEILSGNYDILRSDIYKEERLDNNLYVEDVEIVEKNTPIVLDLYKYYDINTIKKIYEYCIDNSRRVNFSKLEQIRSLIKINNSIKKKKLDIPVWKFIQEARKWVKLHPIVSKEELEIFIRKQSTDYANSIPHVVNKDILLFGDIDKVIKSLFDVIINKSRPNKGMIKLSMRTLDWTTRQEMDNEWGDENTRDFFIDEIMEKQKVQEEPEEEEIPDLGITPKDKLEDVLPTLGDVIHSSFDYNEYTVKDGSNDRFMRKQENNYGLGEKRFSNNDNTEQVKEDFGLFNELAEMGEF